MAAVAPSERVCRQLPEVRVAADRIDEPRLQGRRRSVLARPARPHVLQKRTVVTSVRHVECVDCATMLTLHKAHHVARWLSQVTLHALHIMSLIGRFWVQVYQDQGQGQEQALGWCQGLGEGSIHMVTSRPSGRSRQSRSGISGCACSATPRAASMAT